MLDNLTPGAARTTALPHACPCGIRWAGSGTAHCPTCHRTFSGVTTFDVHRRGGACHDPAGVGLELLTGRAYDVWGRPAATEGDTP